MRSTRLFGPSPLVLLAAGIACVGGRETTSDTAGAAGVASAAGPAFDVVGFYHFTQISRPDSCAPQPLPRPAPATAATDDEYFAASARTDTLVAGLRVTRTDSGLTFVASDTLGGNAGPPFTVEIRPDGGYSTRRSLPAEPEGGPRRGGRRFFVEQQQRAEGRFEPGDGTPRFAAEGEFAHVFREDSASGAIFTTCTRRYTVSGTRGGQ